VPLGGVEIEILEGGGDYDKYGLAIARRCYRTARPAADIHAQWVEYHR
jgi:hypothetical protein